MAETETNSVKDSSATPKKERSPSFPFIGLPKALERARAVYAQAKRHEARVADVADAWGTGVKSSGTLQTIAALLAYGLLEDQGSGDSRKVRITDLAFRALEDQRPGAREAALAQAARSPKLIAEYIERWSGGRPSDGICISELRIDRGFTDEGARAFLRVFDETVGFTKTSDSDIVVDKLEEEAPPVEVRIGDFIQWSSQGSDQFKTPRAVTWISEDGSHVRVHGELTGIPVNQITVVPAPVKPTIVPTEPVARNSGYSTPVADINVLMRGTVLEITATVDLDGLEKLKEMLSHYEKILKLMAGTQAI